MKTFIIILLIAYVLYYGVNILYDLFFKKEKNINDEDESREEISLEHLSQTQVVNVEIEDVELLTTPSSMEMDESQIFSNKSDTDMEALQKKYKEEQQQENKKENIPSDKEEPIDVKKIEIENQINFLNIMKQAETSVQMIVSPNGSKLFKSTLYN